MASKFGAVWAVDIGNNCLKALHLRAEGDVVEVIGFDNIEHGKILTGSGITSAEKDELIALSLRRFVKQNNLDKDDIVVSVPSQNSFSRFVNLPPVEPKRIPEIIRFEAAQQIPFDISDVQWDWQLMTEFGGAKTKVGIFAIKTEVVGSTVEHFSRENMQVSYVQMAPMALYNYVLYDRADLGNSDKQAIVVLDIGAENTDLVVCTRSTVWQRAVPMGGNAFTKAISDTFKLNFEKAEKLKRTAAMSKYARQVFQAMRPVFTDLASEIQRSLGFYSSSNPDTKLLKIIALGGGTKMRGLLKYLAQSLQIPVERPDSFKRLTISSGVSAAKFHESVSDFGIVYGLALQGLGLARIESNLLPRSIARSMAWASKAKYFTAAACLLLMVSLMCFARTTLDRANYKNNQRLRQEVSGIISMARQAGSKLKAQEGKGAGFRAIMQKEFELFKRRDVIPLLHQTIISTLPNEKNNPEQKGLYEAFAEGNAEVVMEIPRKERKQIFVTSMSVYFSDDIGASGFDEIDFQRGGRGRIRDRSSEFEEFGAFMGSQFGEFGEGKYSFSPSSKKGKQADSAKEDEEGAGFVVTIAGYSPYKNLGELMDPVWVEDDQNRWGVITRLLHLDDIVDGNSPFKLYNKTEVEHFKLEIGEVDVEAERMPAGIGLEDVRLEKSQREIAESGEQVLIDPMTKEIISKVVELDEDGKEKIDSKGEVVYKVNDHWFILNAKFIWKDAPKVTEETGEIGY